eukprot:jgi/Bigna1/86952/estExt_fgenesh1_pg.C_150159
MLLFDSLECFNDKESSQSNELLSWRSVPRRQYLGLSNNQLESIPKELSQLKNLSQLYLYNNHLESIPKELSQLKNLKYLHLGSNHLESIPKELSQLKNLKYLSLGNNHLESIPKELSQLKNLSYLDLSNNHLESIPKELYQLNMSHNNKDELLPWELRYVDPKKIHFDGKELITMSYNEVVHLNEQGLKTWLMALANMYEIDEMHINKLMGEEYSAMDLVHIEKEELMEVFTSYTA